MSKTHICESCNKPKAPRLALVPSGASHSSDLAFSTNAKPAGGVPGAMNSSSKAINANALHVRDAGLGHIGIAPVRELRPLCHQRMRTATFARKTYRFELGLPLLQH